MPFYEYCHHIMQEEMVKTGFSKDRILFLLPSLGIRQQNIITTTTNNNIIIIIIVITIIMIIIIKITIILPSSCTHNLAYSLAICPIFLHLSHNQLVSLLSYFFSTQCKKVWIMYTTNVCMNGICRYPAMIAGL